MLIPSKLTRPTRLNNAILRPRILHELAQANAYKLVLFRSPAGYGKTTIVAQWLLEHPNTAWFSIDKNDNDEFRFVNYLLNAINKASDNACPKTVSIAQRRQYANLASLFSHLFEELITYYKQTYIVLDDFHLVDNAHINEGLKFFIKHIPENLSVVITSRSVPALGIANLRVRDQLIEMNVKQLAFDQDETQRFFDKRLAQHLDLASIQPLLDKAQGWPSALQLIAYHLLENSDAVHTPTFNMENFNINHLWDYLAEEVFDDLTPDAQQFLMQAAILDHFDAEIITSLTGRADALAMLENFHRLGLFTSTTEEDSNWFRFHPLFSEFLCHQRHALLPDIGEALHSNASKIYLTRGNTEKAIEHALRAHKQSLCVDILNQDGWKLLNKGEFKLLKGTLQRIDKEHLFQEPKLLLLRAWLAQNQQRYHKVEALLDETERELKVRAIELDSNSQGEYDTLRAQITINQSQSSQALEYAQQALSLLDSHSYQSRIISMAVVGEAHYLQGHLDKALSMMQQTEKFARQYQLYPQVLWALIQQSEIYYAKGQINGAFTLIAKAQKLIQDQNMQQLPITEFLYHLAARLLYSSNKLLEAEEMAYKGLEVLLTYNENQALSCYALLAKIYMAQGKKSKALYYINHCLRLLDTSQVGYDQQSLVYTNDALLTYWHNQNDNEAISTWLEQTFQPHSYDSHLCQIQGRNIIRAQLYLGYEKQAQQLLHSCIQTCEKHELVTDLNHNLILDAVCKIEQGNSLQAQQVLKHALELSGSTNIIQDFLFYATHLQAPLKELSLNTKTQDMSRQRIQILLAEIKQQQVYSKHYFDESFVNKMLLQSDAPEVLIISPLTQREWQVLGLIYSGYSNEQIANKLRVAPTTIKTHIRNLYQKLNIESRKQAIAFAKSLLERVE